MFVQEADDPAVLTWIELVELVDGEDEIPVGNLQARLERAGVLDVVDVDLGRA